MTGLGQFVFDAELADKLLHLYGFPSWICKTASNAGANAALAPAHFFICNAANGMFDAGRKLARTVFVFPIIAFPPYFTLSAFSPMTVGTSDLYVGRFMPDPAKFLIYCAPASNTFAETLTICGRIKQKNRVAERTGSFFIVPQRLEFLPSDRDFRATLFRLEVTLWQAA